MEDSRINELARQAAASGVVFVDAKESSQPRQAETAPQNNSETQDILEKWRASTTSTAGLQPQRHMSPAERAAAAAKAAAEQSGVTDEACCADDAEKTAPPGRNAPQKQPGLRFIAIVIDGQVVEGMAATERLAAALSSEPTIIDVTERDWLPEVGDFYRDGKFLFNPEASKGQQ